MTLINNIENYNELLRNYKRGLKKVDLKKKDNDFFTTLPD